MTFIPVGNCKRCISIIGFIQEIILIQLLVLHDSWNWKMTFWKLIELKLQKSHHEGINVESIKL